MSQSVVTEAHQTQRQEPRQLDALHTEHGASVVTVSDQIRADVISAVEHDTGSAPASRSLR